jgi:hypothetical protein
MVDVVGATTNLIGAASSLGSSFGSIAAGVKLPAPNILANYASYNYVIGLHPLTINEFNFPDSSYKSGKVLPIICKSAGANPDNRIQTNYGKQDFFINNLTFESLMGYQTPKATNVSIVQFDVYEPYSIGLFMLALQKAADNAGFQNWRDAPYLLSIEFRGNTETGSILKVPFSTRHIPVRLTTVKMTSSEQGTRYMINAFAAQGLALTTEFANLRTDAVIKGKTIQEVLQTGEQSLQSVVNNKLQEYVKKGDVKIADQVVILFPKEETMPSSSAPAASGSSETKTNKAYVNPQITPGSTEIFKKIGVSPTTLQQSLSSINDIGSQTMGFDQKRRGDPPPGNQADTWDPVTKTWLRGKLIADASTGTFKFSQDIDIPTVINQIILSSSYADTALKPGAADGNGMVTWWRVDTQIYYVDSKENISKSGTMPKIAVYRVVPFKVHLSKVAGPNVAMPGYDQLKARAVKRYDYLFTGKNTEVLKFDIDFSVGFANTLAADSYTNSTDVVRQESTGNTDDGKKVEIDASPEGRPGPTISGQNPSQQKNDSTGTSSDKAKGGGGQETTTQRVAKTFHDAITNPYDMIVLDLEIMGDPYWIVSSGMGNYNAKPVAGVKDLHKDGSVNWQTSEVDVIVNFRSPIDINQVTGMYDFKGPNHQDMTKDAKAGPAIGFTGLYCVNMVTNTFRNGEFRQSLKGFRRNGQEYKTIGSGQNALNSKSPAQSQQGGDRGTRGGA